MSSCMNANASSTFWRLLAAPRPAANANISTASTVTSRRQVAQNICAERTCCQFDIGAGRTYVAEMEERIANLLGALALAVIDRVEAAARATLQHGGETPAALVVIGYGQGMSNDMLRR